MSDEEVREDTQDDEEKKSQPAPDETLEDEGFDTDEWIGEDWDEGEEGEEEEDEALVPDVPDYVDNGDGTISDPRNHLMWKQSDTFAQFGYGINWFESNDYIEELNEKKFAGFDDWRLCSFEEAKTLFAFAVSNKDKDGAEVHIHPMFESGGGHNTWTYEEKSDFQQYAMTFSFVTGNDKWEHKDNEFSHARPVRDEVKDTWEPAWRDQTRKFEN